MILKRASCLNTSIVGAPVIGEGSSVVPQKVALNMKILALQVHILAGSLAVAEAVVNNKKASHALD